jgi:hypothetical protein
VEQHRCRLLQKLGFGSTFELVTALQSSRRKPYRGLAGGTGLIQ